MKANRNVVLGLVVVSSFITPFLGASVNIALPAISRHFEMNAVTLSWVAMSYLLSSAVFLVPMGSLADRLGRVRIFVVGTLIVALSSFLCAWAYSTAALITLRIVQGIGSSMMFGTNMAIITSTFPPGQRGRAIGINVTSVYLGLSLGPVLGGLLTHHLGWQSIFYLTAPLGLLVTIAGLLLLKPEDKGVSDRQFDYRGSLIYVLSMSMLMYGLSKLPDLYAVALVIGGAAGLILFGVCELKTNSPVFDMKLFLHNRVFALSNLAALINYATTFAITFLLSLYLQYVKGLTAREAGLILVIQPAMMALVASYSGRLSDRVRPNYLSAAGLSIICMGLILLAWVGEKTPTSYLIVSLIVMGIGFGLFSSPNTNLVMSSVETRDLGIASATLATMRLTGQMISIAMATLVIHVIIGNDPITDANRLIFMRTIPIVFGIFIPLSLFGIWASLAHKREG